MRALFNIQTDLRIYGLVTFHELVHQFAFVPFLVHFIINVVLEEILLTQLKETIKFIQFGCSLLLYWSLLIARFGGCSARRLLPLFH